MKVKFIHINLKLMNNKILFNYLDCGSSFASKSALSYHLKSQHLNKPIRKDSRKNESRFNEKIMEMVSNPNFH